MGLQSELVEKYVIFSPVNFYVDAVTRQSCQLDRTPAVAFPNTGWSNDGIPGMGVGFPSCRYIEGSVCYTVFT